MSFLDRRLSLTYNVDDDKSFRLPLKCIKIGPWGGTGAYSFDIGGSTFQSTGVRLRRRTGIFFEPRGTPRAWSLDIGGSAAQITRVRLHTGTVVHSLEFSYVVDGKNLEMRRLGGDGGASSHTFELLPGEYLNSMVGSVQTFCGETRISKVGFTTNLGKKHGPFGEGGGVEFTVPVADGRIVGFFGQFNRYLNGIGVYLAPN